MKSVYKLYRDRLVQISGRSRSLYSKNLSSAQSYNLGKIFECDEEEALNFKNFLWGDGKSRKKLLTEKQLVSFIKNMNIGSPSPTVIKKLIRQEETALIKLKREVEELEKETGRYELFVGYPFVEGTIGAETSVKAPLLLFPARVLIDNGNMEIELIREEPVLLNKVFILAYAREKRLNIDEINLEFNDLATDFPAIVQLRDYLEGFGIPLKYNKQRKTILDAEKCRENKLEEIEIKNYCVLGRFPLANSIYYDYNALDKGRLSSPVLDALLKNKILKLSKKKPQDIYSVSTLDFAQENTIKEINKNGNAVIYGPPGTGKSQTLANIISDGICKNKRILVVSQKKAALDVLYNRLGKLNTKALMLPDPEKSKSEFYQKVKQRHELLLKYKPTFDKQAYEKTKADLKKEINELEKINSLLFTRLPFGLTLQQMYALSADVGQSKQDLSIHQAMQGNNLLNKNYTELYEAHKSIKQRNKANLYYDFYLTAQSNPLISYIKTDLDAHQINKLRAFISKLISRDHVPFNIAGYKYSRYMLVYSLENHGKDDVTPLVDMIAKLENPALFKKRNICFFPLFLPALPFFQYQYSQKRAEIKKRLGIASAAIKHFTGEFDLLNAVLEPEGLAMVIDSIAYGNDKFLKKLLGAIEDYSTVKAMNNAVREITDNEMAILDFARETTKTRAEFLDTVSKTLYVRIYDEALQEEKKNEEQLSKTLIYHDIKNRIAQLQSELKKHTMQLALDSFNSEYKNYCEAHPEDTNNFVHRITLEKNRWSIRRMVEFFENYLIRLFPCWLLSPEAVSSLLPMRRDTFDLALFDEASQVFIESTIPAVYRAKNIVVSGDNKQLRPTSVFVKRYMGDDTYNADMTLNAQAVLEVESLLDLAASRLKPTNLTYHYRSKYEELINFSNYAFYDGRLNIAPNITKNKNTVPIERVKVEGKWINRRNYEEAKEVIEIVKRIFRGRKENDYTIGIVTFNAEQEEYIKDLLDEECQKSDAFKRDYLKEINRKEDGNDVSLFVKNLENVQGDERDIIIFSIGYARNEENKVNAQFGTLSMAGGENRLNVAITRAKEKIYVVTSIEPEEFTTIDNAKNAGPKLLKKYLQYARAISQHRENEAKAILGSLCSIPKKTTSHNGLFEVKLKESLEAMGYIVDMNLGNSDYKISLGIYDKGFDRYVLGIECDYAAYGASDSVFERDIYRSCFLENAGWKIMRVWSRDWWLSREALLKSIEKEIEAQKRKIQDQLNALHSDVPTKVIKTKFVKDPKQTTTITFKL